MLAVSSGQNMVYKYIFLWYFNKEKDVAIFQNMQVVMWQTK